ncbi:hypothetical protein NQ317_014900 [Molorchus minor]|uniref:Uncharacterized protein n=1 Tax=Molorchus minor TaxID=1323400 RepID=A0ABQ9J8B1_9CUCU|nr:hypothetical protein NQ317_014900 [Molorchus minor]
MAPKDNLSAVLYGINDMRLISNDNFMGTEQRPVPVPNENRFETSFRELVDRKSKKLHLLKIQFRLRFKGESIKLSHSNH